MKVFCLVLRLSLGRVRAQHAPFVTLELRVREYRDAFNVQQPILNVLGLLGRYVFEEQVGDKIMKRLYRTCGTYWFLVGRAGIEPATT